MCDMCRRYATEIANPDNRGTVRRVLIEILDEHKKTEHGQ